MKIAVYARVSTRDGEQDPETQLYGLRQYAAQRGWEIVREFVDQASATDLRGRLAWRELLEHVRKGGIDSQDSKLRVNTLRHLLLISV